jgi:hypothetical protein
MGELDKFKGQKVPSVPADNSMPARVQKTELPWEKSSTHASATIEAILSKGPGHFAIALDATASMTPLIDMAKEAIKKIFSRVIAEAKVPVRVQLFVFRDYDVGQRVVEQSHLTSEANELSAWLNNVNATGGGANNGEAIEQALIAIKKAGEFNAVLIAGDEPFNARSDLDRRGKFDVPTAAELARIFGQRKCPIHAFLVGSYPDARRALNELASLSGGCFGELDGTEAMVDMAVLAMLAALKGSLFVEGYMERTQLSHRGREFGRLLLKGPAE